MIVQKKLTREEREKLVWMCLYDHKYVRAGYITDSYYTILEQLLRLVIVEEGGQFKDADKCVIKTKASSSEYKTSAIYDIDNYTDDEDYKHNLGFSLFNQFEDNHDLSLIEMLNSIDKVSHILSFDNCWHLDQIIVNDTIIWERNDD